MTYRRRVERLEYQRLLELAAEAGRPYGLSGEEVLAEARQFLALSPAAQAAEIDALFPADNPEKAALLAALCLRHGRQGARLPLTLAPDRPASVIVAPGGDGTPPSAQP